MGNIKRMNKTFIFLVLIISTATRIVSAFPIPPSQFYGDITIDGKYADIGTNISVYDIGSVLCGSFSVEKKGGYILSCKGDNPKTIEDEGAKEGEPLNFYLNDKQIEAKALWHAEGFTRLDITLKTKNETIADIEYPSKEKEGIPGEAYLIVSLFLTIIIFIMVMMNKQDDKA